MDWLTGFYLWLKALHIISVIAWMAGLLYLPRLFVYHAEAAAGSPQSETFKVMERRLLRGIMNPAMILVTGLRPAAHWQGDWWHAGWWQSEVPLVAGLTVVHHLYARWRKDFGQTRKHQACPLLSLVERGADPADDRYRVARRPEAPVDRAPIRAGAALVRNNRYREWIGSRPCLMPAIVFLCGREAMVTGEHERRDAFR
jgi:putative membrane protein